ncbi:MAG TPA: AAA family ATPase [Solirubrobacter sp.]|nr:AAA family ATPase [Solirubrobacter sp.]
MTAEAAELAPGAVFADHEIRAIVGRGGMGVVYRALHRPLNREVALKLIVPELSSDTDFRERFKRESRVAASIEHPNAIPIYHASESDGLLYITMRFVDGTDLRELILAEGALGAERVALIAGQIAGALQAAHDLGIVHRDVKPANILIGRSPAGEPQAYLTDFGLTKQADSESVLTRSGMLMGSFDYIAPEQLEGGTVDARTDVYALGCVIYEALTGVVPFPRDSQAAKLFAHIATPPPSLLELLPDAPPALDELVLKAMAKDPDERYASADELAAALRAAVGLAEAGAARPSARAGLPSALEARPGEEPFVGRAETLAALRERFAAARAGERAFVLLSGEPGMGKSRLSRELARHAHGEGAQVLFGRCEEEPLAPYQPFTEAVHHYLIAHPEAAAGLAALGRLVPELREQMPPAHELPGAPETERYQLFEAVAGLLIRAAEQRPLVLVLDDLHLADKPTLLLARHVFERTAGTPVLFVATARDTESAEPFAETLAQLRRDEGFSQLTLTGLDEAETASLVGAHAEGEPPSALVRRIREQTGGNPFFIGEMLRAAGGPVSEAALDRMPVPEGVKALIGQRLGALDEPARQVLGLAAVIGRKVRVGALEALVDPGVDVLSALEAAEAAGLVIEARDEIDSFAFSHALVREVLYEQPSTSRRVRLHLRVGEALEALPGASAAELAHHFYEARHVGGAGKALEHARAAAEQASRSVAYEEASAHHRRALAALELARPDDTPARCEILLALGGTLTRAGDADARPTFLAAAELARADGDAERLARAALGFGGHYAEAGVVDRPLIELLEEALDALGEAPSPLRALVLARLADALMFAGEPERPLELSRAAVDEARGSGNVEALAAALASRHGALLHAEHLEERLELSENMLELARRSGQRELEGLVEHRHIYDLVEAGALDRARAEHAELAALADELRQPLLQHFATGWAVVWAQMDGRFEDAQQLAGLCFEYGQRAQSRDAPTQLAGQMLSLQRQREGLGDVIEAIEGALAQYPALVAWHAVLPLAHLDAGQPERARELFETFAADDFAIVPRDMFWLTAMTVLAEACALLDDAPRARTLYAMLAPYADLNVQVGAASCFGSTRRFTGELAIALRDWETMEADFERALADNQRWNNRPVVAITQYEYARGLRVKGDADRAAELEARALATADELGMPFVRRRLTA